MLIHRTRSGRIQTYKSKRYFSMANQDVKPNRWTLIWFEELTCDSTNFPDLGSFQSETKRTADMSS